MKAIVCDEYGPPEQLQLREIDKPAVQADRVLLPVCAASINPADLHGMAGSIVTRAMSRSFRRPARSTPGSDVAGVVEAVGEGVTGIQPGDEVFGTCGGSLAEYANGKNIVPKPERLTFEQAASLPIAGITALQGLRDKGRLQPGQTVLINGAAGGVGTFAVQIARAFGGEVTGVCSTRNVELVHSIGADRVIDYTREDFARSGQSFDLVLDVVGNRSLADLLRVVKPEGTLVLSGGAHHRGHGGAGLRPLALLGRGVIQSRFVSQRITAFIANVKKEDLLVLKDLADGGKLTPVIDRTYQLGEAVEAFRYLQTGHARGKIVITM